MAISVKIYFIFSFLVLAGCGVKGAPMPRPDGAYIFRDSAPREATNNEIQVKRKTEKELIEKRKEN